MSTRCKTCGRPAPFTCSRPVEERNVYPADLWIGDFVLSAAGDELRVIDFEKHNLDRILVQFDENRQALIPRFQPVTVIRRGICGEPCCEVHVQELDDDVHYCPKHRARASGEVHAAA